MKTFGLSLIYLFLFFGSSNAQTKYTLISSGDWDVPSRWSPQGVPGPGDFIDIGDWNLNINKSLEVAGLSFRSGTVYFTDSNLVLTLTDSSVWYGGEIDGGGIENNCTVIIPEGAVLYLDTDSLNPESHRLYEGTTLINRGTIRHTGITNLGVRGYSRLINEALYDLTTDADFHGESFSGGYFINNGTFRKSGGGSELTFMSLWWEFQNNGGIVDVQSGTFEFNCTAIFNGADLNADENATLSFTSGTQLFKGEIKGSPAGKVLLSDATINIDSTGAILNFTGKGFQWEAGTFSGGGVLTIPENALLVLNGMSESPQLSGGTTFLNKGTIRQEGSRSFSIRGNSTIDNQSLFEITTDAGFTGGTGSGGTFINKGILLKSGSAGATIINLWWNFLNEGGLLDVKTGTFDFQCNGTFTGGNYNTAAGATISFSSGSYLFKGTLNGSPAGTVKLSDATINIDSLGATLNFTGTGFQWDAGYFSGGGVLTIPDNALLIINGMSENPQLYGGTTILNKGTIRQEGSRSITVRGGSVINNQSLFEVITDADFTGGPGSGGTFINSGILHKSGGSDITSFNLWWVFQNQNGGIIDVDSGEVEFTNLESLEESAITGSSIIDVPGTFENNGITSPGNSIGMLSYIGNYTPSESGILDVELGGILPGSQNDQLNVTGAAKLNGTIKISLMDGFVPVKGDTFVVLTSTGALSDSFKTITVPGGLYVTVKRNSNSAVVIIDSVGTLVLVEEEIASEIISSYDLMQNYPNPFNPTTNIQFTLPQSSYVKLEIFNSIGESAEILVDETLNPGKYDYKWNASGFASGIYICKITAGKFNQVRKMILLK